MRTSLLGTALGAVLTVACIPARAGEKAPAPASSDAVVLDLDRGSFRIFLGWRTPVMVNAEGKTHPLLERKRKDLKEEDRKPVPVRESARPAKDWTGPDFDDSRWSRLRGPALVQQRVMLGDIYTPGNPAEWDLVCLRGKFRVSDPAQVKGLKLALSYHGGAVIYVNGTELHRGHLTAGELKPEALAERYGEEGYVRPDGKLYGGGDGSRDSVTFAERIRAGRVRAIPPKDAPDGVAIPGSMLRKGVNVIAVEVRTAPINDMALDRTAADVNWQGAPSPWPHAGVLAARLTSPSAAGLTPNAGPLQGIEVANCQTIETVQTGDFAHPNEKLQPVRLTGARNGCFSGKVMVSSAAAIKGLKASATELAQADAKAKIPATAVKVRFAEPAKPTFSWNGPERFDRLLSEPPAEFPPVSGKAYGPTAAAAVWVTVQVPADATPGEYKGTLSVEADGLASKLSVPVELKVHDWKVPEPKDYAQRYNLYQSPDTVAQYYKVPLWSDEHWKLMGKSFEVLRQAGNSVCVLNLVVKVPSLNNTESMIRWIKKPDGGYDCDFSIAEKYMDLYDKVCGKPAILELFVWEHHTKPEAGKPPPTPLSVSVLDLATGKVEPMPQPAYDTPENEAFWKPVLTEFKKRLEKRGWYDVTAVCYTSYCWGPTKEQVDIFKNIWPDGKWMNCTHSNPSSYGASQGSMPVVYSEWVWGCGGLYDPDGGKGAYPRPWLKGTGRIEVANPRYGVGMFNGLYDGSPLVLYRAAAEAAMQGGVRGFGRMGADFWPLPIGKDKRMAPLCDSYAAVGPANSVKALISPGADGATFNERMEMFREGQQNAEAIVFLQRALEAKTASAELARKIADLLDERARYYLRTRPNQECNWLALECSDWQGRDDRLFALCAEVAKAGGGK